jgi:hypothetical protein
MNESANYKNVLKNFNEETVRKLLLENGAMTQTDLAKLSCLSFPTVSKITSALEEKGQILISGYDSSNVGRKSMVYQLNADYSQALLIYFDQKEFHVYVTNVLQKVIKNELVFLKNDNYIRTIDGIVDQKLNEFPRIQYLVIGVPGAVNEGVIIHIPEYPQLKNFNLKQYYEEKYQLKVEIGNDMNIAALGHYIQNFSDELSISTCIRVTDKGLIGLGIIANGSILKGHSGFIGEVYCMRFDKEKGYPISPKEELPKLTNPQMLEILEHLVVDLCVLINPKYIVFYENKYTVSNYYALKRKLSDYLPESAIPTISVSDRFEEDYQRGLAALSETDSI